MRKMILASVLAGLAVASASASAAEPISYTYAEVGYTKSDTRGPIDVDGAYLRGSYEFADTGVYALAGYQHLSNNGPLDLKPRVLEVGAGYHYSLSDRWDVLGEVAYQRTEIRGGFDADNYRFSVGTRAQVWGPVEVLAKVNHYDGGDVVDSWTTGTVGAQYHISSLLSVTTDVELGEGDEVYTLGLRAKF